MTDEGRGTRDEPRSAAPRQMAPVDDQMLVLMSGVEYGDDRLKLEMERELRTLIALDRPLRVYLGIDPTATSLTLGHTVPLRKLRQFQQFGHHAIFLIGDYTALIGDPSDKNKLRPTLTQEEIKRNEKSYFDQAATILDASKTATRSTSTSFFTHSCKATTRSPWNAMCRWAARNSSSTSWRGARSRRTAARNRTSP